MRTLYITEGQERALKNRIILTEADDRIKKVNKIIDAEFSNLLNLDGPVRGPEYYVNDNPETTWRTYLLFHLRHEFGLMTNADMKYLPVVAKLAYSDEVGFDKRNDNGTEIGMLQSIVSLFKIDDTLFQNVKTNINNITFNDLYEQLKPQLEEMEDADTFKANHVEVRDDYDIVEVPDFETANYYGNQSCSESKLCYTQYRNTWNGYTKNGINRVYVCLKHGWENIPEVPSEGNPYDEYGTSMIFVFIDPDCKISTSNCRWNHHVEGSYRQGGGVDNAFTKTSLCETVGRRFDETFKPYPMDILMEKGYVSSEMAQKLLNDGVDPTRIFQQIYSDYHGFSLVVLNDKYNYLNTSNNTILSKKWFDYAEHFTEYKLAKVCEDSKYNFIRTDGSLVLSEFVDLITTFNNGVCLIANNRKCNLIDVNGNTLSDRWFDEILTDGYSIGKCIGAGWVDEEVKGYFITRDKNSNPLANVGFERIDRFEDGLSLVVKDRKYNFVDDDLKFIQDQWFDSACDYINGFAKVYVNGGWNFINIEGKIISDMSFDQTGLKFDKFGTTWVLKNGKFNHIDVNGNLISRDWFDNEVSVDNKISKDCYIISKIDLEKYNKGYNGKSVIVKNILNGNGELVSPQFWFNDINVDGGKDYGNDFVIVEYGEKSNLLNVNTGELALEAWVDYMVPPFYTDKPTVVIVNQRFNYVLPNGKLLSKDGFDRCGEFDNGLAKVKLNGQVHVINVNGQIVESIRSKKFVIITEEQERILKESILLSSIPDDIADAVYKNKTSIGNNPAIPNIFEAGYVEKLVEKRFKETVDELKKIGEINDVSDTKIENVLSKLISKCQEIERPNRGELEKIAANYLIELFGIPNESVQMELSLVDFVNLDGTSIKLDPADGDGFIEYEDIADAESIKDEVYKRRLIDAISMGAGMKISSNIKDYMNKIYEINPSLLDLYRKIIALNDYLLFTREDLGITDENKQQIGTVEVVLGHDDELPKIAAQGAIFPVLLSESVRGLMELFASHGLPKDLTTAQTVISKADYLKAEPWDMRIGPALWEIITDSFGNQVKTDLIPYLYKRIAQLPIKKFNFFMREVLAKTRKGKRMMARLSEKAKFEKEYSGFEDKMSKFNTDKNVITDEYIHPEEL